MTATSLADPMVTPREDRRVSRFQAGRVEERADLEDEIRIERRSESVMAGALITVLVAVILYFVFLSMLGILYSWDQRTIAFWLGMVFLLGGTMMTIYRKHFQRDIIIAKKRHKKTIPSADVSWWRFK